MDGFFTFACTLVCACACVCVCVCVYMFIYPGGDLLNTHRLMGTKLRSPCVQKLINHTELVFFLEK